MINVMDDLASALSPTSLAISSELLDARKRAIQAADEGLSRETLSRVAFGLADAESASAVEEIVAAHDETFPRGHGDQTVTLIAAISLEAQIDRGDVVSALIALSSDFVGGKAGRSDIVAKAHILAHTDSKRSRVRPSTKMAPNSVRPLLAPSGDLDGAQLTAGVRALAKRLEDAVKVFDDQILLMDEEIDVLWWSRAQGHAWSERSGPDRVVAASLDLASHLHRWPATFVIQRILHEEIAADGTATTLLSGLVGLGELANLPTSASSIATPILHILGVAREYNGTPEVVSAILEKDGIGLAQSVRIADLTDQILRECAYVQLAR